MTSIKRTTSWNGYPGYIQNKIIKRLENKKNTKNTDTLEQENIAIFSCRIPYAGIQWEKIFKNQVRKLERHIDETIKFRNIYSMKKLSYYYNTKDKEAEYLKSQIVYEVCCPVYKSKHIGKTDRNFGARVQKSLVYNHLL